MYAYSDPVTELVESLCIQFEFDTAHKKLQECEKVHTNTHNEYHVGSTNGYCSKKIMHVHRTLCRCWRMIFSLLPVEMNLWRVLVSSYLRHSVGFINALVSGK